MKHATLNLKPGDEIQRSALHDVIGGQRQSGISPSSSTEMICIFSMPPSASNPYTDGWFDDGYFHYTGEGQVGDQVMKRGNKALRDHIADGKTVHLFEGHAKGAPVTYVGDLELVDYKTVPGVGSDGEERSQFRYRFAPVAGGPADLDLPIQHNPIPNSTSVDRVPVEQHLTETYDLNKDATSTENERREAKLVSAYLAANPGITRHRINIAGTVRPIYTDAFDPARNLLIEAKGSTSRNHIRTAIGQLLDYRRFINPQPDLAILLPSQPTDDLANLLADLNITLIVDDGAGGFTEV